MASERNIALRLMYDGSSYHGWQVQNNNITVQEVMENALRKVCGNTSRIVGCGRTDAGVHALRYCANFHTDCTIPVDRIPYAINSRLPADIAVVDAVEVFSGTSSSNSKRLETSLDAGYVTLSDTFLGHTLHRKVNEDMSNNAGYEVLMDTNNSSVDFYEREKQSLHE